MPLDTGNCSCTPMYRLLCLYLLAVLASPLSASAQSLSLADASKRVIDQNPQLQVFTWRFRELEAQGESAALSPETSLSLEAENFAGSGTLQGFDSAELTLAISSIVELGGKATARLRVVNARVALAEAERQGQALDLLGEVAQRFIAAQALQAKLAIATDAKDLAATAYGLVLARVEEGASPAAEKYRALALKRQTEMMLERMSTELEVGKFSLAAMWGDSELDFSRLAGDLFIFPELLPFSQLFENVVDSPAIRALSEEGRLRRAEVDLARARSRQDIDWTVGLRRFEESDDAALTFGVSTPLFTARRGAADVRAAQAAHSMVDYYRQARLLELRTTLYEAWHNYRQGSAEVQALRNEILPALEQALIETQQLYERGRYSYRDWVEAQRELLDARLAMIDIASDTLLNLAIVEQLTGASVVATPSTTADGRMEDNRDE